MKDYNNKISILGNGGQLINYDVSKDGVKRKSISHLPNEYIINFDNKLKKFKNLNSNLKSVDSEKNQYVIKYPLEKGVSWVIKDKTRLKMKIGYDKIFETFLPVEVLNTITSTNETVKIGKEVFKKCLKVVGKGNTSYNAGPPLGNINISIMNVDWFAPKVGLIKTYREEISDSETMGELKILKTYE